MQRTAGKQPKPKIDCFTSIDDEVELLLKVTNEYKVQKSTKSVDWELVQSKYARASKDWKSFRSREKPRGTVCPPFWILTVEWAGARSCLFGWRHRFQIASFSPSILENNVFKKHRFQIAPLWRAFSNDSVFGDRFRRCSVDDSRIRSKTAPFSFENGLVWTGPDKIRAIFKECRKATTKKFPYQLDFSWQF